MSKVVACLCTIILLISVGVTAQTVTTCYPVAADDNTGSTDGITITANSLVNAFDTEDGWMKFDISAIPDTDEIVQIEWNFYVNDTYYPYWSSTPLTTDPVGADPATLHADIIAEASVDYYNYQNESSTYEPGWKMLLLGGTAAADLQASLAADWFGLGVVTRDSSTTYYVKMDGWNEVNMPYIAVTHTASSVSEACFVADSQAAPGLASYNATIGGGFTLASIDWDGMVTELYPGTYGSELTVDISGPLGATTITLGSGSAFTGPIQFTGSDTSLAGGDPAGDWTFDFYETYDDGFDGLPDANWDDICFTFAAPDPCSGPDSCEVAELITAGTIIGDTTDCSDTFPSYNLWSWELLGNDHVYAIDVACAGSEICVTFTPDSDQDGAIALSTECVDGPVTTAVAGADDTLSGDPEAFCYIATTTDVGTMYIYVDSYGAGSQGAYTLDVTLSSPVINDTCETAIDVTGGGLFSGTTVCAANDYDGYCGTTWAAAAPDVAYAITVADGDTVDVAMIPLDGQDPILYIVGDCDDVEGTCVAGADGGLGGDPEYVTTTIGCGGTYYIIADGWSTAEGAFDLDVVVTPAVPVDTFDVGLLCDPGLLTLPAETEIGIGVINTTDVDRQIYAVAGVTLCTGTHMDNLRAGSIWIDGGVTAFKYFNLDIPRRCTTCNCTLVFDLEAEDITPCEQTAGVPAGWVETTSCGITTYCE